jgi:ABC-type oligopeptide transport system ATPase subunit
LLRDLQQRLGLTMVLISSDLAVVEYICDTVFVLYLGRIMEIAPSEELYANPRHPYTQALLSAIPQPETRSKRQRWATFLAPPIPLRAASLEPGSPSPSRHASMPPHYLNRRERRLGAYVSGTMNWPAPGLRL